MLSRLFGVFLLTSSTFCSAGPYQDLGTVQKEVEDYLWEHYLQTYHSQNSDTEISIDVKQPDPRLKLKDCGDDLAFEPLRQGFNGGKRTVKVRCISASPWQLYLNAHIDILKPILVLNTPLTRGDVIDESHLSLQKLNVGNLSGGYIDEPNKVLGLELKRNIKAGVPIRQSYLRQPQLIQRGDSVTIESFFSGVRVITEGEALSDGRLGQRIRIRNEASKRIIKAEVISAGLARVNS